MAEGSLHLSELRCLYLFCALNSNNLNSQIIVGGVASTRQDVGLYASCSLLAASMKCDNKKASNEETNKGAIEACVDWLMGNEFISIQKDGPGNSTVVTYSYFYVIIFLDPHVHPLQHITVT